MCSSNRLAARLLPALMLGLMMASWASSSAAAGETHALLVAVGDYNLQELRPLKFTRADVLEFHKSLVDSGVPPKNIVLMHDDNPKLSAHYKQLGPQYKSQDYLPESRKIRSELELMLGKLRPDDSIIVAFSGHGVQFKEGKKSYYCPSDARLEDKDTLIAFEEVFSALKASAAARKLLLVDACQNDPQSALSKSRKTVDLESITRPQSEPVPEGIIALFSCKAGQKSFEMPELGHGVFFYHILEGWKGSADLNKDGKLTYKELAEYSERKTTDYTVTNLKVLQTPQLVTEFSGEWVLRSLAPADPFQPGSVWVGAPTAATQSLRITKRDGEVFEARFTEGAGIDRIVKGTIKSGTIRWFRKDVQAVRGGPGSDNLGTINGDRVDISWGNGPTSASGTFTLQRMPADTFQKGTVWSNEKIGNRLIVLDRRDGTFRANFVLANGVIREINGTVADGVVTWLAKNVRVKAGTVGGDNYGAIRGDTIDFSWNGPGNSTGTYLLTLQKPR